MSWSNPALDMLTIATRMAGFDDKELRREIVLEQHRKGRSTVQERHVCDAMQKIKDRFEESR